MFDKFGEFDSALEINNKANELKAAGDKDGIKKLGKENGLDVEDVNDFIRGDIDELTTPMLAALGKINIEVREYKIDGILREWISELEEAATDPEIADAIRRKGKSISDFIARTADYGFRHKATVDKRIVAKCPEIKKVIGNHEFSIGIPDKRERKKIMREYYLGGNS